MHRKPQAGLILPFLEELVKLDKALKAALTPEEYEQILKLFEQLAIPVITAQAV